MGSRDTAGKVVPAGTVAVVRSSDFLRALERATALSTLIRQRRLTPSCGGHAPTFDQPSHLENIPNMSAFGRFCSLSANEIAA
jgi:hypothetical protein